MLASVGCTEKSALVWHAAHCAAAAVGMWLAGFSVALKKLVPLWHCEHLALPSNSSLAPLME